jgi:hypothetical protein
MLSTNRRVWPSVFNRFFREGPLKTIKSKLEKNMDKKYIPPNDLSENSKQLFSKVVPSRAESPERVETVHQALKVKDRADECAKIIEKEGLQVITERSNVSHAHPLLKTEKDNRQLYLKIWAKLKFDEDPFDPEKGWEAFPPQA